MNFENEEDVEDFFIRDEIEQSDSRVWAVYTKALIINKTDLKDVKVK